MDKPVRYEDYERQFSAAQQRVDIKTKLAQGFRVADLYLNRSYLDVFAAAPIVQTSRSLLETSQMRVIEIDKIVTDEDEKFTDKLISIYSALYSLNSAVALIIDSDGETIRFLIGTRAENAALAGDVLQSTLKGNFPGIDFKTMSAAQTDGLVEELQGHGAKSLASVTIVPSVRDEEHKAESFVQGIEKFIDTMRGKRFTMVSLATPLDPWTIQERKRGYEELYSSLTPHGKISASYGENESESVSVSLSNSFSKSVNRSVSRSNTNSTSQSSGRNSSHNSGSSYSGGFGSGGWNNGWGGSEGYSSGTFDSFTSGNSFTESFSDSTGTTDTDGVSKGNTNTVGTTKTLTVNFENKSVLSLLERAEAQLKRFEKSESFGMWEFSSYFLSKDIHTTVLAGNAYRALMTGSESNVESAHLNVWSLNRMDDIAKASESVLHFMHPYAEIPAFEGGYEKQLVTPTNMVNGQELPLVMGFPKKSVTGLAVVEMAEFGRSVVCEGESPKRCIEFGNVYHMGVTESTRVKMDLNLLSSHCFITGSSGSGKSFATYELLDSALQQGVKLMVVEPAKGEYKHVFGGLKGIKIYTTDPNAYRMLKINPFQFPNEIHLLSHIEQLIQIFNAAWPLYAAMPAILKQAVVDAYVKCGWDVQNSIWIEGISDHKYPVFADVLETLPQIINTSDYSADSKGDYKGALLTRVQSMTVGINGVIFKNSEGIDDSLLFDSNVIVDLSELGSDEAIALIMGVLIMKLGEYRKAQRKANSQFHTDLELKHLMVLEEAHNLLKRTSKEQSQDGANMVGRSVEMISNSIKEMRTYGEGFLIIDQSPMAVDASAIENTATKIIMNLPAKDACEEVGSALSLNEQQTKELARLNIGVAAVFQKGWLSPVLMKVDKWDNRYNGEVQTTDPAALRKAKGQIVQELLRQRDNKKFSPMKLRSIIRGTELPTDKKRELDELIASYNDKIFMASTVERSTFAGLVMDLIACEGLYAAVPTYGIANYEEYMSNADSKSEMFADFVKELKANVEVWSNRIYQALNNYVVFETEDDKMRTLLELSYHVGKAGRVEWYPKDRLAMACRMQFRMCGIRLM